MYVTGFGVIRTRLVAWCLDAVHPHCDASVQAEHVRVRSRVNGIGMQRHP